MSRSLVFMTLPWSKRSPALALFHLMRAWLAWSQLAPSSEPQPSLKS
ncbi:uncharacterized protein FFC1_07767 [Fusarium fujikuroi]|nr:uncharacterized protein FFC1_07767 [Fusarium fujikuroi]